MKSEIKFSTKELIDGLYQSPNRYFTYNMFYRGLFQNNQTFSVGYFPKHYYQNYFMGRTIAPYNNIFDTSVFYHFFDELSRKYPIWSRLFWNGLCKLRIFRIRPSQECLSYL